MFVENPTYHKDKDNDYKIFLLGPRNILDKYISGWNIHEQMRKCIKLHMQMWNVLYTIYSKSI